MSEPIHDEADRLIAAALRDHARIAAPARLRRKLERRHLRTPRRWIVPLLAAVGGALATAALVLVLVRPAAPALDVAAEAAGDHLRILVGRGYGVAASDMHQVKPWFAGKLDFTPPVTFLGDDDYPLRGGDVAVFLGKRAAAFIYGRRLHVISLFVVEGELPAGERTVHGFHVITWGANGFGYALVSDLSWDELRTLEQRLR
jgi:anti-sigma factor RsiW